METTNISVVVPVFNEESNLPELLTHLRHFNFYELIFVDGGSADESWQWLQEASQQETNLTALQSDAGRAKQMNAGANAASGEVVLFLHADTRLPDATVSEISKGMQKSTWGRFDLRFIEPDGWMKVVAYFINKRSRLTSVATGDQALFVSRDTFINIGGFAEIPLMEDVAITKTLRQLKKPYCSKLKVSTSARRWLQNGRLKTIMLMWKLRWKYFRGVSPEEIAKEYRNVR